MCEHNGAHFDSLASLQDSIIPSAAQHSGIQNTDPKEETALLPNSVTSSPRLNIPPRRGKQCIPRDHTHKHTRPEGKRASVDKSSTAAQLRRGSPKPVCTESAGPVCSGTCQICISKLSKGHILQKCTDDARRGGRWVRRDH